MAQDRRRERDQSPTWSAAECGVIPPDQHSYELFLQFEKIEHRTNRIKRTQSDGIFDRLHRTLLDEHFRVEGRRIWFENIEEMQAVLDDYLTG